MSALRQGQTTGSSGRRTPSRWFHRSHFPVRAGSLPVGRSQGLHVPCSSDEPKCHAQASVHRNSPNNLDGRHRCALSVFGTLVHSCWNYKNIRVSSNVGVSLISAYFGNFCIILINKLSSDSLLLCSRPIASRNFAKAGFVDLVVRIASFALFQLFTNAVYVSNTIGFENCRENLEIKWLV